MTPFLGRTLSEIDDETQLHILRNSLDHLGSEELEQELNVMQQAFDEAYNMRDSNKFVLDRTMANLAGNRDPSVTDKFRRSLAYRHMDLQLDPHTQHIREAKGLKKRDTERGRMKDMADCYSEGHELSLQQSLISQQKFDASQRQTFRPSAMSNGYTKKQLTYLKQKAKTDQRQIQLLKLQLKMQNQLLKLKQLDQEVIEPDPQQTKPTLRDALSLGI